MQVPACPTQERPCASFEPVTREADAQTEQSDSRSLALAGLAPADVGALPAFSIGYSDRGARRQLLGQLLERLVVRCSTWRTQRSFGMPHEQQAELIVNDWLDAICSHPIGPSLKVRFSSLDGSSSRGILGVSIDVVYFNRAQARYSDHIHLQPAYNRLRSRSEELGMHFLALVNEVSRLLDHCITPWSVFADFSDYAWRGNHTDAMLRAEIKGLPSDEQETLSSVLRPSEYWRRLGFEFRRWPLVSTVSAYCARSPFAFPLESHTNQGKPVYKGFKPWLMSRQQLKEAVDEMPHLSLERDLGEQMVALQMVIDSNLKACGETSVSKMIDTWSTVSADECIPLDTPIAVFDWKSDTSKAFEQIKRELEDHGLAYDRSYRDDWIALCVEPDDNLDQLIDRLERSVLLLMRMSGLVSAVLRCVAEPRGQRARASRST